MKDRQFFVLPEKDISKRKDLINLLLLSVVDSDLG